MIKKTITATALLASVLAMPPAHAGGGGFAGATEATQLLNHAEMVSMLGEDVMQTAQQLSMLENMYSHSQSIPIQAWGSAAAHLGQLVETASRAQGVAYTSSDALSQIEQQFGNGSIMDGYQTRLRDWNASTRSQIASVLTQFGLQASRFGTTQSALQQIQNASQSATGRQQVLQAGNQIAGLMVNQLQDLQGTILAAEQARMHQMAIQNAREEQDRLRRDRWLGRGAGGY